MCVVYDVDGVLYGPMHSKQGVEMYKQAIQDAIAQGGKVEVGGKVWTVVFLPVTGFCLTKYSRTTQTITPKCRLST